MSSTKRQQQQQQEEDSAAAAMATRPSAATSTPERKRLGIWSPPLFRNSPIRSGGRQQRNATTTNNNNPKRSNPPPPTTSPSAPTAGVAPKSDAPAESVANPVGGGGSSTAATSSADHPRSASAIATGLDPPPTVASQGTKSTSSSSSLPKPHFLCRSKFFRNMCQSAFHAIDLDDSGTIDEKELYSGLLLIHLKLGCYAGPAACRPLSRERCLAFFHKMDIDHSGSLDQDEFHFVMGVLFGNVLLRVLAQWSLTLMIVPLLAQTALNAIYATVRATAAFVANLDEHSSVADSIELTVEGTWQCLVDTTPDAIVTMVEQLHHYLSFVPDSVWNSIPLTLLSTLLGLVVVPWTLFQIDDFFQYLAERRQRRGGDRRK